MKLILQLIEHFTSNDVFVFRSILHHHDLPIFKREDPNKVRKCDQENVLFRIDYFDI